MKVELVLAHGDTYRPNSNLMLKEISFEWKVH